MINRNSFKFDGFYPLSIQNHYNLITKDKHSNTQNKNSNKYLISKRTLSTEYRIITLIKIR